MSAECGNHLMDPFNFPLNGKVVWGMAWVTAQFRRNALEPPSPILLRASYTKKIPACQTSILCWREARTTHTILDSRHIAF